MNHEKEHKLHRSPRLISGVFLSLAISLQVLLAGYWIQILEPKLREEATADAKLISGAQATQIENVLAAMLEDGNQDPLFEVIDRLLLYKEPSTGKNFFLGIRLELDEELDFQETIISRGDLGCEACFKATIELYSQDSFDLIGFIDFYVSDEFYRSLSKDIRQQLVIEGAISLILLLIAWGASVYLLKSLQKEESLRRESESALLANQEKYHRLVSSLNQYFVYGRDLKGHFTSISESVESLTGYKADKMVNLVEILTDNPINQVARHYLKTSHSQEEQLEFEIEIRDNWGGSRWLLMSEVNVYNDEKQLTGIEGLGRDITKQKLEEAELVQAKEEAEIASQAKGLFLANMSHEIRTPMNAIIGNTYLTLKTKLDEKQTQFIKRIDSAAQVLLSLVNDILDISKIEAGKMDLETISFTLDEVINNLSNVVINQAQQKNLEILYDIETSRKTLLKGDPLRLGQVLLNLVNNAIKFTEKGEILVSVKTQSSENGKMCLEFAVKDDGIGIPEEKQTMLFTSFNQLDNSTTRKYGGTGLGLSICQNLCELMGGEIWVESEFGKGSTFKFTAYFGFEESSEKVSHKAQEQLKGLHVLVVDDSHTSTEIMSKMLSQFGCIVSVAHSGEHCIEQLREHEDKTPINVIIMNWKMPDMNGVQTATAIQKVQVVGHNVDIIIASTYGEAPVTEKSNEVVFAGFLAKPVTESSLFDVLVDVVNSDSSSSGELAEAGSVQERFKGRTVLLAEDNKINQEVAIHLLEDVGIQVVIANNGREAIEKAKKQLFDLILMDIQMPVMDGFSAANSLLNELKIETPIVAMTAHASPEDFIKSLDAGMVDHVTKPIDVHVFYSMLAKWLDSDIKAEQLSSETKEQGVEIEIVGINVIEALKRLGHKQSLFEKLIEDFVNDYEDYEQQILEAQDANDEQLVSQLIHKLKGEAGNISAHQIHRIASELEAQIRNAVEIPASRFHTLFTELANLKINIQEYLAEHGLKLVSNEKDQPSLKDSEFIEMITELDLMLEEQQLDAVELGDKLLKHISKVELQDTIANLKVALSKLDFKDAIQYLQQIKNHYT